MSNSILTLGGITRYAAALWQNSNAFLQTIDKQYDNQYGVEGAKIGSPLQIRLPNDYVAQTGPAITPQATNEVSVTMTLATQKTVPISFTSADQALKMDDYAERVLAPAINVLAGAVAADIMNTALGARQMVANLSGSTLQTPSPETVLLAGAQLDLAAAPRNRRIAMIDPLTQARLVSSMSGYFNPQRKVSDQFETGMISEDTLGFDWYSDQTILKPTTGAYTTATTVNGASQTGNTLVVAALGVGVTLNQGDVINIAGVHAVNPITKVSTGQLANFVVTANVAAGATSIPIYPAITPPSGSTPVAYQTVDASPANGATISLVMGGSSGVVSGAETYRKNLFYYPQAFAMATADLPIYGKGIVNAARAVYKGTSLRIVQAYDVYADQLVTRIDVLYGSLCVRPDWVVTVPDVL